MSNKPRAGFFYDREGNTIGIGVFNDKECKILDMKGNCVATVSTSMKVSEILNLILSKKDRLVV